MLSREFDVVRVNWVGEMRYWRCELWWSHAGCAVGSLERDAAEGF